MDMFSYLTDKPVDIAVLFASAWGGNCSCHAQTGAPAKHIYEFDANK